MSTERKNQVISSFVTTCILTIVFLVLYFLGLSFQVPPPQAKQLILIEFASGGGGGGGSEIPKSARNVSSSAPDLATQDVEEAPVIVRNPKPNKTKSENNNAVVSEPKPDPGASYRPGKGGGSGGGTGTGTGTGAGMGVGSGEGAGAGSGKGIGYGSGNRGYVNIPDVNINENGVIYVEVHVTAQGNVINARILSTPKYPTNITNAKIQQDCLARALSAKYVTGKEELRIIVFK
jgi:hypothetical protein